MVKGLAHQASMCILYTFILNIKHLMIPPFMMKSATVYKIALHRGPMNGLHAPTTSTPSGGMVSRTGTTFALVSDWPVLKY